MTAVVPERVYAQTDRIQRELLKGISNSVSLKSVSKRSARKRECVLDSNFASSPSIQCYAELFRKTVVCAEPWIFRTLDKVRRGDDRAEPKLHDEVGKVRNFIPAI